MKGSAPSILRRAAYLVTTYELYSENSLRVCALSLKKRGVNHHGEQEASARPGSDITCVLPTALPLAVSFRERGFPRALATIADEIHARMGSGAPRGFIPAAKWYTPLSQLLQVELVLDRFEGSKVNIHILPERCTSCGVCARGCERGAWLRSAIAL